MAFKIAGSMALKNAASKVNPVILEPMMKVEVIIPEEYMGDIMGDITSRRGRVEGMEARGNAQVVAAMVPLAEMFGYATSLRSNTQGRGVLLNGHLITMKKFRNQLLKKLLKRIKANNCNSFLYSSINNLYDIGSWRIIPPAPSYKKIKCSYL